MLASSAPESPDAIEQLIDGCLRGDQQAWDLIVTRYWRKVFNVAYKFVGRHDLAEDLTQDVFLKIFKALGTFDRRANFQTWLISVSRNLCIDHYRSVRKERELVDRSLDSSEVSAVSGEPDALLTLERGDRRARLHDALAQLPVRRPPQLGHSARLLQENGTSRSKPRPTQRNRANGSTA